MNDSIQLENLLPHRAPFLLLDSVNVDAEQCLAPDGVLWQATGYSTVRAENPFVGNTGQLESVALAEMIAQCAGALGLLQEGRAAKSNEQPPIGFLAAMRHIRMYGTAKVGDVLHIFVRRTANIGPISVVDGAVFCGQDCLAKGQLKIFIQEENNA